jgi:hypothetical protein
VASDGDNAGAGSGSASGGEPSAGDQTTTGSTGAAQLGPLAVDAPVWIASEGDEVPATTGDTGTSAQGEPVSPLDEGGSGTEAQGGPVGITEDGGGPDPLDGSSTSGGLRLASDFVADAAGPLPLTGFAVAALFLIGFALLSSGAAVRRGGVASG